MRPLVEPLIGDERAAFAPPGEDVVPVLLDRLGGYCSICERPLWDEAFAWDSETGTSISPHRALPPSTRSLLLCRTCDGAQTAHDDPPSALTLPFDGPTFTLRGKRLFEYERGGACVGPVATIAYFELGRPRRVDVRTTLRAKTWEIADDAARRYRDDESGLEGEWLALLMVSTGFLSVWATAMVDAFYGDPDPTATFFNRAIDWVPDFYPGTDWERLLRRPPESFSGMPPAPVPSPLSG